MFKKIISLTLMVLLLQTSAAFAKTKGEKETQAAEKVRTGLLKFGTGPDARVELKLRDKTKLAGYVSEIGAESFTLISAKTGEAAVVAFPSVAQVKGNHLSTGAKLAIGAGIAAAVILTLILVKRVCNESSC
ncbi:MAG: hypothetical protein HOP19_01150 [Acidobacteria bacterium]|nr:hypothetical protein [Acidobacteriota bacterium]